MAACCRFYGEDLALPLRFGGSEAGYAEYVLDDGTLALFDVREMASAMGTTEDPLARSGDAVAVILGVESVDAACAHLAGRGVPIVCHPTDHPEWMLRTAHLRDPDGNLVEVNEPLSAS